MQLGNIKKLFTEDRAVSPVIGVILMVAITVILAAVIGTFVLGLGDDLQDTSPTASISFDFDTTSDGNTAPTEDGPQFVTVAHEGGDTISEDASLTATVNGDKALGTTDIEEAGGEEVEDLDNTWDTSDGVSSGDSMRFYVYEIDTSADPQVVDGNDGHVWDGETVRINWESVDGDSSATLGSSTAP